MSLSAAETRDVIRGCLSGIDPMALVPLRALMDRTLVQFRDEGVDGPQAGVLMAVILTRTLHDLDPLYRLRDALTPGFTTLIAAALALETIDDTKEHT